MRARWFAVLVAAVVACFPLHLGAAEAERPLWEVGVAAGGGWFPDYPAASQNHWLGIALPTFVYRGEILRSDESGLRGRFLRGERVQLDVSLGGALPARPHLARLAAPAADQAECGDDHRLAGARLTRHHGEPRMRLDDGLVDHPEVQDPQFLQHMFDDRRSNVCAEGAVGCS